MDSEPTLASRLALFDEEREFLRRVTIPEEDRARYTSAQWSGEYRWFRSPNIVCPRESAAAAPTAVGVGINGINTRPDASDQHPT